MISGGLELVLLVIFGVPLLVFVMLSGFFPYFWVAAVVLGAPADWPVWLNALIILAGVTAWGLFCERLNIMPTPPPRRTYRDRDWPSHGYPGLGGP